MNDQHIKEYLDQSKRVQELEYYIEMESEKRGGYVPQELLEDFNVELAKQFKLYSDYGITRQMLTDYDKKRRNATTCHSVSEALSAMEEAFNK